MTDLHALTENPEQLTLASGTPVLLEDLRARQFFKLLRIISHGALPLMRDGDLFKLDPNTDPQEFGARLLSVMLLAIPDAEDETIEFLRSMVKPVGLIERRTLNRADTARNSELWAALDTELANPDLNDLVTLVEAIVRRESADIQALGKRLAAMTVMARKTGQLPSTSPRDSASTPTSSADSPAPTTFSPASTDGATRSSQSYASDASASVSPPSGNAAMSMTGSTNSG